MRASRFQLALALLALGVLLAGCATGRRRTGPPPVGSVERGVASWYGPGFHGRRTASGEIYDQEALTAAHQRLPFDTLVEVRSLDTGQAVRVRINDRGPFVRRRVIDLSHAAADAIGMVGPGTAPIELRILAYDAPRSDGSVYAVQVGAFADPARARDLCDELRGRWPEAEVESDGVWSRVRIGRFAGRLQAEALRRELAALGLQALIVLTP